MSDYSPFLKDFFNNMIDIIRTTGTDNYKPVDYYPAFKAMREELFKEHDIEIDVVNEKELIEQLPNTVKLTLDELSLPHQDFVDVVFLKKTTLEEKPLIDYLKKIHEKNNWIAGLYHFQGFLDEKEYGLEDFKSKILACFDSLKEGQSFELLSNVAVFIEAYGQTHEGKEFLNNEFDLNYPQDSFRELFRRLNNASVFNAVDVQNGKNGDLKCNFKSGGGGDFDGLYVFPDDKGGLMIRQVQISATNDMGTGIEKNSVFRHAISNIIIAKALDNGFKNKNERNIYLNELGEYESDEGLTEAFKITPQEYKDERIDILQEQKQKALFAMMKEHYSESFGDAKNFKDLVKNLNANLHNYIYECFGEKPPLKAYAVEDTLKSLNHVDVSNVFVSKTAYQKHAEYDQSTLGQALGNDVDLNMKEFRHGLQLVGLSTFNQDNQGNTIFLQNEGLKIAFSGIVSRCVDNQGEVDATKLNKLGQKEFETLLFKHFILPEEDELQRNYDILNKNEVKDSFKYYLSRIILREQDDISLYDKKLEELEINTTQTLKGTCKKLLDVKFLDEGEDLRNQIKEKNKRLEEENKRLEEKHANLLNKGIRKLCLNDILFNKFTEEYNVSDVDIEVIKRLKNSGFDGEDDEANVKDMISIKSKITKEREECIDEIDCAVNIKKINNLKASDSKDTNKNLKDGRNDFK